MADTMLCRNCGKPRETGSQIWYECPLDGSWKSPSDRCVLHNENFEHAGNMTITTSGKGFQITLKDCPFTSPYFGIKAQGKELFDGKRKTVALWQPKEKTKDIPRPNRYKPRQQELEEDIRR